MYANTVKKSPSEAIHGGLKELWHIGQLDSIEQMTPWVYGMEGEGTEKRERRHVDLLKPGVYFITCARYANK